MPRFLLLNPPAGCGYVKEGRCQHRAAVFSSVYPPMTLAYLASILRKLVDVRLIDAVGSKLTVEALVDMIKDFKPDFIICNTTTPTFENDLGVLSEIKKAHDCKVFVYGVHVTVLWRDALAHDQIDGVIIGEPDATVAELAKKELKKVPGLAYKDAGTIVKNKSRDFMNLDELPLPAWDLVDLSKYRMPVTGEKYVLVTTGRGCPYNCSFCVSQPYYGKKYRKRSVKKILAEIRYAKTLGVNNFFFFSETFTLDKAHVLGLCDALIREKLSIRWVCNSRVDTVDSEVLKKMKAAGCWMISFGIESASQEILDKSNKGITAAQSTTAVETASQAGLTVVGHFIFGLPGETKESILETTDFSLRLPLTFAEYYVSTPFPGSRLFGELNSQLVGIDWKRFEYSKNIVSGELDLERSRKKAYRLFYLRPRTILNLTRLFGLRRVPALIKTGIKFILSI
jgi:radical SAM superfamily enzyme YgiQ (UPF0313 family)